MQVMPDTARDPGFGIRPSNGTPEDDARMGQEYLAKMHDRYGGDLAKMWAAYHSGPGTVDKLAAAYGAGWWKHLGPQGRDYVNKNLGHAMASPATARETAPPPAVLTEAVKQYPFVSKYNPVVIQSAGDGSGDYAETWPVGEQGTKEHPRPKEIPLNRVGVQVFKPDQFGPADLAAEFLHVDPRANQTRQHLLASLSPAQIETLKHSADDYAVSLRMGETPKKALENAVDSALRGYTTGQWPANANAQMQYTPQQKQMLEGLKTYMRGAH